MSFGVSLILLTSDECENKNMKPTTIFSAYQVPIGVISNRREKSSNMKNSTTFKDLSGLAAVRDDRKLGGPFEMTEN
jgi:hypothetical protein